MEVEGFFRSVLEKMGASLDASFGAADVAARNAALTLAGQAQRAIEAGVRTEPTGCVAPHLITLTFPFHMQSQMDDAARAAVAETVKTVAESFIRDRRYATLAPVAVRVTSDVFRDAPGVQVGFGDGAPSVAASVSPSGGVKTLRLRDARGAEVFASPLRETCVVHVGRSRDNDVTLADESVSRFHAALTVTAAGVMTVRDLGSANGTFVRERRTPIAGPTRVATGERIFFGDVEVIPGVE
jgi:hypothetical protein